MPEETTTTETAPETPAAPPAPTKIVLPDSLKGWFHRVRSALEQAKALGIVQLTDDEQAFLDDLATRETKRLKAPDLNAMDAIAKRTNIVAICRREPHFVSIGL